MHYTRQQGWAAWAFSGLLFLTTATVGWFYYDLDQQKKSLESELAQAQSELRTSQRSLNRSQSDLDDTRNELSTLRIQLATVENELNETQQNMATLERQNQRLEVSEKGLNTTIESLNEQLSNLQAENESLLSEKTSAEQQLSATQGDLVELQGELSEAATTAELYQAAREQLALEQAENETYSETIDRLKAEMSEEAKAMAALEESLQSQLSTLNQEKEKLVTQLEDGTTAIKLPESILFASGSAKLNDDGLSALNVLSAALKSFPNHLISIQGHTDSKKISSAISEVYPTNWELSTARAASAVRELIKKGVTAEQIQAVGYADTRPLVKEVDAQTRQQNRRIEVILFPNQFKTKLLDN